MRPSLPNQVDGSDSRLGIVRDVERHVPRLRVLEPPPPIEQHSLIEEGDLLDLAEREFLRDVGQDLVVPISTALEGVAHLEYG